MAYSAFTTQQLKDKFNIRQKFVDDLFSEFPARAPSPLLRETLDYNIVFALSQGSEKARSEFIIAPILTEISRESRGQISIFSGIEFTVDVELGLNGFCDFLISRSPEQMTLDAPVIVAVEAKQEDFNKGINQCFAEMIAARIYNQKNAVEFSEIYGCVTTGDVWRFLVLRENLALIETATFDVRQDLEKILGILWAMSVGETILKR